MSTIPPTPEGRPYEAPSAPPSYAGAPARRNEKGSARLGVFAFVVALLAAVIGSILVFIAGLQFGAVAAVTGDGSTPVDPSDLTPAIEQAWTLALILAPTGFIVMAVLALWGLVQGIVATVKNRGRGWGIAAIVIAVFAWVPVVVFLGIGTAAGLAAAS